MHIPSLRSAVYGLAAALLLTGSVMAQTRTIETTFGPVEIPENPQRIITTHYIATQPLVELGVLPVGQGRIDEANTPFWDQISDIPFISEGVEINVEQVAALQPDLIFSINLADEQQLAQLREIAPVIVIGIRGADRSNWQNRVHQIADAVNKLPEYEELETQLAARQQQIKTDYADVLANENFSVFSVWTPGQPVVFTSESMSGKILTGAGAQYAPASEALALPEGADVNLSEETLGDALVDSKNVLYNINLDGSDNPATAEFKQSAVYEAIPAVAAGRSFPIGKLTIAGFADANFILDNFEKALANISGK